MPSALTIRRFLPTDQVLVRDLIVSGMAEARLVPSPELDPDLDDLHSAFSIAKSALLVAVDDQGRVVGSCGVLEHSDDGAELRRFYVQKEWRGRGVGKRLIEAVLKYSRECAFPYLWLHTDKGNTDAIKKYCNLGFEKSEIPPARLAKERDGCLRLKRSL